MKRYHALISLSISALSFCAYGDECSHLWNQNLAIEPEGPKGYVGDTFAAYGLLGYKNVPNLAWRMEFRFPHARFMSIETYTSTKKIQYDAQFDFEFLAAPGSFNPFIPGTPTDIQPRNAIVHLVPSAGHSTSPNIVHISPDAPVHAVYYRVYVPHDGVPFTESDLPQLYPYDYATGRDLPCPEEERGVVFAPDLPQAAIAWVPARKVLKFKRADETIFAKISSSGNNAAVPSYLYSLSRMRSDQVAVVRFKSPTFPDTRGGNAPFDSRGDVRYWSLCTQNLVKGDTLRCLPDFQSKPDRNGNITLVIGRGEELRSFADEMNYNYVEDTRAPDQPVLQLIYRNLLPAPEFEQSKMYGGEYLPTGVICSRTDVLDGRCAIPASGR